MNQWPKQIKAAPSLSLNASPDLRRSRGGGNERQLDEEQTQHVKY